MAYCTSSDVEAEFKALNLAASGATVSTAEVTGFIAQTDAFIDASIQNRYETPVTAPISVSILKTISIWLVKSRILSILSVKTPQDKTKQDPDGPTLRDQALKMLEQIRKGQLVLSDATTVSGAGGLESFLDGEDVDTLYTFQKDGDSW